MYTALYRKCRPKVFEDLIGQEYLVKTLKNQIVSDRIAHAYLFCGTRGTGKTSTAKIFSKAVNCTNPNGGDPCGECEMCRQINAGTLIDVVEIDAASNNRVENIRDLIEDVKYPPHAAKYKVYIIDEVHMLSISAFNALLKTLEEPPEHVVFILATTDPQKVPPTILSRCQRYDFKRIRTEDILKLLRKVVDENGIFAEDKTLKAIARLCDGAVRDALSILDQCMSISEGKIDYEDVVAMLGLTSNEHIYNLVDLLIDKNIEDGINEVDDVIFGGKDIVQFIKDIVKHLRNLLMVKISKKPNEIIDLSDDAIQELKEQAKKIRSEEILRGINIFSETESECKASSQPRIWLEMAIIKFCRREYDSSPEMLLNRIGIIEDKIKNGNFTVTANNNNNTDVGIKHESHSMDRTENAGNVSIDSTTSEESILNNTVLDTAEITIDELKANWQEIIAFLNGNKNKVVSMLLTQGRIKDISGHIITIEFDQNYSINKKILEQPEKRKIAEEAFMKTLNKSARINYVISSGEHLDSDNVEEIKSVFGDDFVEIIE